ncbi:MAG: Trk system potassium transporter TrkA [Clostridiales bacterium]|nr:Trk system potassium transporter TrkA [Clostridiales bacterium]
MNIIIVGCGKVGQKLAEKLSQEKENNITVVDLRRSVITDLINQYDIMGVCGSCSSLDTLLDAGVKEADILIAVTGSDEVNLLTCLIAKKAGGCQTVARVRKPEYAKELHLFKEDLGLALIINPEFTAATEIARVLRFPSAIQIDTFAKGRAEILKFRIPENSMLNNMLIRDIHKKIECDILVCGVERDDMAFIPGGDFVLKSGDNISIVASIKNGTKFFKQIGIKTNRVKDTMIVGGGATAYYLAKQLLATGIKVKIIEQNPERCVELCSLLPKASIINSDGTDNRVLLEEGLEYAESFVSLTNIDEENILLSLFAKSKMKGKLVTKINRIAYDDVISGLDLDTTIYPKNITAEYIVKFVRAKKNSIGSNIETMHMILDGKAEAIEFRVNEASSLTNKTLEELNLKDNTLITCIIRQGKVIMPRGKDVILPQDTVIVVTTNIGFKDITDILL